MVDYRHLPLAALLGVAIAACDVSDPALEDFTVEIQAAASVGQGQSTTIPLTVVRTNFDEPVALTVDGAPSAVSVTLVPSQLAAGQTSGAIQLAAGGSAVPGTSTLTVRAVADGLGERTATLALTVQVTGSFTVTVLSPTIVAAQGGGATATLLVNRIGGFAADVTLAVSGLPPGVSATIASTPVSGTNSLVRFTAAQEAAPGSYSVVVTGSSPGLEDQSASLGLTIIPAAPTASLTLDFCSSAPAWFAFQNEGSEWQRVQPNGTSFTFDATVKVGLTWVQQYPNGAVEVFVRYATRAEHAAVFLSTLCRGARSWVGAAAGLGVNEFVTVGAGMAAGAASGSANFSLTGLPSAPVDVVAARATGGGGDGTPNFPLFFTADRYIIRRSVDLPSGATLPALDFAGSEAVAPVTTSFTVTGQQADEFVHTTTRLWTASGTLAKVHARRTTERPVQLQWPPASQQIAGDLYELWIDVWTSGLTDRRRSVISYTDAPGDRTETVGPYVGGGAVSVVAASPYLLLRGRVSSQPEYPGAAGFIFGGLASARRNVHVLVTSAFLGSVPATWDVTVPDLSAANGFQAGWMPTPGEAPYYQVDLYSKLFRVAPAAGDVIRFTSRAGFAGLGGASAMYRAPRMPALKEPGGQANGR